MKQAEQKKYDEDVEFLMKLKLAALQQVEKKTVAFPNQKYHQQNDGKEVISADGEQKKAVSAGKEDVEKGVSRQ